MVPELAKGHTARDGWHQDGNPDGFASGACSSCHAKPCLYARTRPGQTSCLLLVGTCWPAVLTGSLAALCATPPPDHAPPRPAGPRPAPRPMPRPLHSPRCLPSASAYSASVPRACPRPQSFASSCLLISPLALWPALAWMFQLSFCRHLSPVSCQYLFPSLPVSHLHAPLGSLLYLSVCLSLSLGPIHCSRASPSVSLLPVPPPLPVLGRSAVDGDRVQSQPCSLSRDSSELGHCRGSRQSSSVV